VSALRDLQPDEMSPKKELERIYQLKKLVCVVPGNPFVSEMTINTVKCISKDLL
jgi:hypothetical protein